MVIEKLFEYWSKTYFLDPLSALTALIGLIVFFLKKNKKSPVYIFRYYFLGYVILKFIFFVSPFLPRNLILFNKWVTVEELADYIFTLIEFLLFYFYFKKILKSSFYKKILTTVCYVFLLIGCSILFYDMILFGKVQISSVGFLFNIQAVSLLVPCIFYYIEIFRSEPTLDLLQDSSFWVATGLGFFMISTLPVSLLLNNLYKSNVRVYYNLFTVFYVFYIILFSMITRAYLCKPKTAQ